ncbi:HipA domain-containing protein [Glaciecola punicea]|uniref:HipA domain-containing protein n=1 Tax=Glaciecola punicea TaxID=56804 RepID=UPI00114CA7EC|nr:HipA domain-containing protein [Glaciecola punicea]
MANAEVLYFGKQKALSVERLDRKYTAARSWNMRLPQEGSCQAKVTSSAKKYQSDGGPSIADCLQLLSASSNIQDRDTF